MCLSYTANTMPADALATLRARASADMVLTPQPEYSNYSIRRVNKYGNGMNDHRCSAAWKLSGINLRHDNDMTWEHFTHCWWFGNIKMSSYRYRDPHVKDKTTVLTLTWEPPYLGKTVFILRWAPGRSRVFPIRIPIPKTDTTHNMIRWCFTTLGNLLKWAFVVSHFRGWKLHSWFCDIIWVRNHMKVSVSPIESGN